MSTPISLTRKVTPMCPQCGGRMHLINGKRGQFWGCNHFPECHGTRPTEDEINDGINVDDDQERCFNEVYWDGGDGFNPY
jgi:ssDNA-binding Zn-finger/Zn-ribbon topoisomerase 1